MSPKKAIRKYCLECCLSQPAEVRLCPYTDCIFYNYRLWSGRPRLKILREKCVECSTYVLSDVRNCAFSDCPIHQFRMGKNPNRSIVKTQNELFGKPDSVEES